ncbi:MAG TPA: hypothetical protein VMO26_17915 [Vicinamibacterales bacterium]|nr:hypothetical protein [Vicinamibacterales bacterium]
MGLFRSNTVTLDKELMARVRRYAALTGYASPREFVVHAVEKELAKLDDSESDEEITRRLKGLGYIS